MSHKQQEEEDPFDVFGSDQDDEDNETDNAAAVTTTSDERSSSMETASTDCCASSSAAGAGAPARLMMMTQQRDPSCGPLVFHNGTEVALLRFVERSLTATEEDAVAAAATTTTTISIKRRRERVIQLIDEFCYSRHWMMNIGPEKGAILDRFLIESLERHYASGTNKQPFSLVEVGTYCGYSTIRIAHTILQWQQQQQQKATAAAAHHEIMDFHIFTVDVNPQTVSIARQLVSMAGGLDAHVTFLILSEKSKHPNDNYDDNYDDDDDDSLSKTIQSALQKKYNTNIASFVFLDHDKYKYLSDLKQLEKSKIIRAQTCVAADNVIFHRLDDYRNHLQQYANQGIVETRLEMGHLEYISAAPVAVDDDDDDAVFLPGTTTVKLRALPGNKQRHLQTNADFRDGLELTYYLKDP